MKDKIFEYLTPEASEILDPLFNELESEIPIGGKN